MPSQQEEQKFVTRSCRIPVKRVYGPEDVKDIDYTRDLGEPGQEPFTRGPYPNMYRERLWRIFQLSGYGLPEDENERMKFLLAHGETGIEMEPDVMTLYGMLDIDDPDVVARKEDVGLHGATLYSLEDYERALDGIDISKTYAHASGVTPLCSPFAHACYFALAEKRGIPLKELRGTGEGDMFLTYLATPIKDPIPPKAGLRLNCDLIEFCVENVPKWIAVSVPGTNARETGFNSYQEIAVTLANNIAYIEEVLARGRFKIDEFAHMLGGVGFCTYTDLFEDICTLRAARRMWCRLLKERYGAKDPRSLRMRIHVNVGGSSNTYQQPLNNLIRTTIGALAAFLGGAQSASITGFDEAICIPSELAHLMSVRTHQILQMESGIINTCDPLGGSYYVEWLTNEIEKRAWDYLRKIEDQGGFIAALESGWLHREAHLEANRREQRVISGEDKVVGVNCFQMEKELFEVPVHTNPTKNVYEIAKARVERLKRERDQKRAAECLDKFRRALESNENVMPSLIEGVKAGITASEVGNVMREVFGTWKVPLPI